MSLNYCPKCGNPIPSPEARFCPVCGKALYAPPQGPIPKYLKINTHSYGWIIMAFLVSFLWFKINGAPIFPLGFIGGLVISYWSMDIDRAVGKPSYMAASVVFSFVGMFLGLIIH